MKNYARAEINRNKYVQALLVVLISSITTSAHADSTAINSPVVAYIAAVSFPTIAIWSWQTYRSWRYTAHKERKEQELEDAIHDETHNEQHGKYLKAARDINNIFATHGEEAYGRYADPFKNILPIMSEYIKEDDQPQADDTDTPEPDSPFDQRIQHREWWLQKYDATLKKSLKVVAYAALKDSTTINKTLECLEAFQQADEEAASIAPVVCESFINPFEPIQSFATHSSKRVEIERTYHAHRQGQRQFISSAWYTFMRYVTIPAALLGMSYYSWHTKNPTLPHNSSYWLTAAALSGICYAITELPAMLLRHRTQQHKDHKKRYAATTRLLSKYRLRQGIIDFVWGFGALYIAGSLAKSQSHGEQPSLGSLGEKIIVGGLLALHATHGLLHII